jgi:hypothetical protein
MYSVRTRARAEESIAAKERHHLPGALPDAQVADGELANIAPVGVVVRPLRVGRDLHEGLDDLANLALAHPRDPVLEALAVLASGRVGVGEGLDGIRDGPARH